MKLKIITFLLLCFLYSINSNGTTKLSSFSYNKNINPKYNLEIKKDNKSKINKSEKTMGLRKSFIVDNPNQPLIMKLIPQEASAPEDKEVRIIGKVLNWPNPFRLENGTIIGYELSNTADPGIDFYLYDMLGHQIFHKFIEKDQNGAKKGYHPFDFDIHVLGGYELSSAIYFYYIIFNEKILGHGKMAILP